MTEILIISVEIMILVIVSGIISNRESEDDDPNPYGSGGDY